MFSSVIWELFVLISGPDVVQLECCFTGVALDRVSSNTIWSVALELHIGVSP